MNDSVWQCCPKCDGNKMVKNENFGVPIGSTSPLMIGCNICEGTGLISKLTGLPPFNIAKGYLLKSDGTVEVSDPLDN